MTKRAKVSAAVGVRINERELDILKRIQAGVAPCVLSVNGLAREFSCSVATVRNSIRALEDKDLITVRARFLRNGGLLENEYELTEAGGRNLEVNGSLESGIFHISHIFSLPQDGRLNSKQGTVWAGLCARILSAHNARVWGESAWK